MSNNDNSQKSSPFADLNIHAEDRGVRWNAVIDSLHRVLVDANINALGGALMIYLNLIGSDLLLPNIALAEGGLNSANNYLGISLAAQPNTFKLVNVYPNAGYLQNSERICRGEDLITGIKAMLVTWINGGAFTHTQKFSGTMLKSLVVTLDDAEVDLVERSVIELFPMLKAYRRGGKLCTWSNLNPANQSYVQGLVNSGYKFYTTMEKARTYLMSKL